MPTVMELVKQLREMTGAGMLECKKALEENNLDLDKAVQYLREKGIAKAAKKQSRIAAEGLCTVKAEGNNAILFELNSETDFVAKNPMFSSLISNFEELFLSSKVASTEDALKIVSKGKTVEQLIAEATATIGEKISLRRVTLVKKNKTQSFGLYKHMGGKIVVLSVLEGDNPEVAKNIAMHVAANNPRFLDKQSVDPETLKNEEHIIREVAIKENEEAAKPKPAVVLEKNIIPGRLQKLLESICLVDQPYVKDPNITVSEYLKQNKTSIVSFLRLEVGEGLEKRVDDFAAEVAAQAKL
ncbi:MAG: translation elongation factor Ts [Acholeplasmatales bacterium]|jgi:elongation factor Ts|nr:translation elongation factor Ts [Acholeplasmatales bacterium]